MNKYKEEIKNEYHSIQLQKEEKKKIRSLPSSPQRDSKEENKSYLGKLQAQISNRNQLEKKVIFFLKKR